MAIVSNSGPILSFARACRFDLLREVVVTLTIPEAVYADIVVRGAGKLGAEDVQHATWITRTPVRDARSWTKPLSGACLLALFCFSTWRSRYGSTLYVTSS